LQENFEANSDNGAFEAQYRKLLVEIQQIYESAKEFHGKVGSWAHELLQLCMPDICCVLPSALQRHAQRCAQQHYVLDSRAVIQKSSHQVIASAAVVHVACTGWSSNCSNHQECTSTYGMLSVYFAGH
jgi:hypothetical protein